MPVSNRYTPALAVSTWSLHHALGITYANGPADMPDPEARPTFGTGSITLLDLPAELARRGYHRVEICHFNLASREVDYLAQIGAAFEKADVAIQTLLIDDGDISHPETRARDLKWIAQWIDVAAKLGAENARVVAGKQKPTLEALALGVVGLKELVAVGREKGVRIVTENWFDLLSSPKEVHHVLDAVGPDLGFLADTGNWSGPSKYQNLASVFARAELCHCKAAFAPGQVIDAADYRRCLEAAKSAGYKGPMTLIFESDGDEWEGLAKERDFVLQAYA